MVLNCIMCDNHTQLQIPRGWTLKVDEAICPQCNAPPMAEEPTLFRRLQEWGAEETNVQG